MATQAREQRVPAQMQAGIAATENDWTKPRAMAIPKEGYFNLESGRYGPVYPKSPACYGFTIIAKAKPGTEEVIRAYGKTIEKSLEVSTRDGLVNQVGN